MMIMVPRGRPPLELVVAASLAGTAGSEGASSMMMVLAAPEVEALGTVVITRFAIVGRGAVAAEKPEVANDEQLIKL